VNFISMNACTFENERKGRGWRNTRSGEESLEMFGVKGGLIILESRLVGSNCRFSTIHVCNSRIASQKLCTTATLKGGACS
jgi:hypothetical protein